MFYLITNSIFMFLWHWTYVIESYVLLLIACMCLINTVRYSVYRELCVASHGTRVFDKHCEIFCV